MRRGRGEVGDVERLFAVRFDEKPLMVWGMAGRWNAANAGDDLPVPFDEIDQPRLDQRNEVVREVACRRALVGVRGILVFAALHHIACVGEGPLDRTVRGTSRVPAGVVEVQMAVDDEGYVGRLETLRHEPVLEVRLRARAFSG